jgi:hypothetical protein
VSVGGAVAAFDSDVIYNALVFTSFAAFLDADSVLVEQNRSMDWNSWGTGGFAFFVSSIFNSGRSYALRGGVGLDSITDGALESRIFIGCRAHMQGGGLGCISSNVIVMRCDFIRNVCGGTRSNQDGIPLFSDGPSAGGSARLPRRPIDWKRRYLYREWQICRRLLQSHGTPE